MHGHNQGQSCRAVRLFASVQPCRTCGSMCAAPFIHVSSSVHVDSSIKSCVQLYIPLLVTLPPVKVSSPYAVRLSVTATGLVLQLMHYSSGKLHWPYQTCPGMLQASMEGGTEAAQEPRPSGNKVAFWGAL